MVLNALSSYLLRQVVFERNVASVACYSDTGAASHPCNIDLIGIATATPPHRVGTGHTLLHLHPRRIPGPAWDLDQSNGTYSGWQYDYDIYQSPALIL